MKKTGGLGKKLNGKPMVYLDNGVLGDIHENDNFSNVIVEILGGDGEETVYVFPADNMEKAKEEERYLHYRN